MSAATDITFKVVLPPDEEIRALLEGIAEKHAARWLAGEVGQAEAVADAEREGREAIVARIELIPVTRTDDGRV